MITRIFSLSGDGLGEGYGMLGQAGNGKLRVSIGQSKLAAKVAKKYVSLVLPGQDLLLKNCQSRLLIFASSHLFLIIYIIFRFKEKNFGSSGATSGLTSSLAFTPVQVCAVIYSP